MVGGKHGTSSPIQVLVQDIRNPYLLKMPILEGWKELVSKLFP